jgi:hypothetical protein
MLRWSLGYLAMAIVVAIGFSSLQGSQRSEREVATVTAKQSKAGERSTRARNGQLQDEGSSEDEGDPENYLEYVVEAGPDGHYLVEALVNGRAGHLSGRYRRIRHRVEPGRRQTRRPGAAAAGVHPTILDRQR